MTKLCRICLKEFNPFKTTDRFCSNRCANKYVPKENAKVAVKEEQSMKGLFLEIWNERKHISELSGEPLLREGHSLWHFQFLHVLGHGPFPKFKYYKKNILLGLPEEHEKQNDFEAFNERHDEMLTEYYKDSKI